MVFEFCSIIVIFIYIFRIKYSISGKRGLVLSLRNIFSKFTMHGDNFNVHTLLNGSNIGTMIKMGHIFWD